MALNGGWAHPGLGARRWWLEMLSSYIKFYLTDGQVKCCLRYFVITAYVRQIPSASARPEVFAVIQESGSNPLDLIMSELCRYEHGIFGMPNAVRLLSIDLILTDKIEPRHKIWS